MNILLIANLPVPNGLAGTNRLLSLAKGLSANGQTVSIFILNPTERRQSIKNHSKKGMIEDVSFRYLSPSTVVPADSFLKFFSFLYGALNLLLKIGFATSKKLPAVIIMMQTWTVYPLLLYPLARLRGIPLVQERNEYPFLSLREKKLLRRIDFYIYTKLVLRLFDGMILMTKNLITYFKKFVRKDCLLIHTPMTVDTTRFIEKTDSPFKFPYFAYVGYLWGDKDGVPDMFKAFSMFSKIHPEYKLCVIGDNSNVREFEKLSLLLRELNITDKVIFSGRVERELIPGYLSNAQLLLLARPDNVQAQGGFPTKLGEYLATGVPVVVTKVGEIPDYLTDGKNAFLAEPDNPASFTEKMIEAIDNYPFAMKVGENGKILAENIFSYHVQGQQLIESLKKLVKKNNG